MPPFLAIPVVDYMHILVCGTSLLFHQGAPASVLCADIHERKESLSGMQVSVSDPAPSHPNQLEFHIIAELREW